jgi:hypothetical protein
MAVSQQAAGQRHRPYASYLIDAGTLDQCTHEPYPHLYEIHTVREDTADRVLSSDHILELARLRDFLGDVQLTHIDLGTISFSTC